jgi:DNA-binding NtrC family response regulator
MDSAPHILVVTSDAMLVGDLCDALDESFEARVISAESVEEARERLSACEFDMLFADGSLEETELAPLIAEATSSGLATVLIENELQAERVLAAMRAGVVDVLTQPVDFSHLQHVVEATLEVRQGARQDEIRRKRLRELSSRMIRDRRALRQRIDLLCRDLVAAYRRLAQKVASQETAS